MSHYFSLLNVTIRNKTYGLWTLAIFPGSLQYVKNFLLIRGCIKNGFMCKALQSLFKNVRNVVVFELWSCILTRFFLMMNSCQLLVVKSYRRYVSGDANHKSMTIPLLNVTGIYDPWFSCLRNTWYKLSREGLGNWFWDCHQRCHLVNRRNQSFLRTALVYVESWWTPEPL